MKFEDLLRDFKFLVKDLDTYQVVLGALNTPCNPRAFPEDTLVYTARKNLSLIVGDEDSLPFPYIQHRSLSPTLRKHISNGNLDAIEKWWKVFSQNTNNFEHKTVIANEVSI